MDLSFRTGIFKTRMSPLFAPLVGSYECNEMKCSGYDSGQSGVIMRAKMAKFGLEPEGGRNQSVQSQRLTISDVCIT